MNKTRLFGILSFLGILLFVFEVICKIDGILGLVLTLAAIYLTVAGAIGACITSKKARAFVGNLVDAILRNL